MEDENYGENDATSEEENVSAIKEEQSDTEISCEEDSNADADFNPDSETDASQYEMEHGPAKKPRRSCMSTGKFSTFFALDLATT